MKAVYFRFMTSDGDSSGWVGLAVAKNTIELFWVIDRFGDPHGCEIMPIENAGMCVHRVEEDFEECDDVDFTGQPDPYENEGWQKPKWPPLEDVYARTE
jgi:hypothetical protein